MKYLGTFLGFTIIAVALALVFIEPKALIALAGISVVAWKVVGT